MQNSNEEQGPLGAFAGKALVATIIIILLITAALIFGAVTAAGV